MNYIFANLFGIKLELLFTSQNGGKRNGDFIDRALFLKLVEMERYRVHRTNHQFSLILFNVVQNAQTVSSTKQLAGIIKQRIRRLDQVGWFDKLHIGVLLPNTSYSGAQIIARDICCRHQEQIQQPLSFETLCYPETNKFCEV